MSHHIRLTVLKIMAGVFLCSILTVNSYSLWINNKSGLGFCEGCGDSAPSSTMTEGTSTIGDYIVRGAGYYIESYAGVLQFMQKVELKEQSGLNYEELKVILDKALESMANANTTYVSLQQLADNTPYNYAVIEELKDFDYDRFSKDNGFRADTFSRVKKYLGKGDIRSIYGEMVLDTGEILALLHRLKLQVDAEEFPSKEDVWKLSPMYAGTQLFGQYVSQVFYKVME